MSQGKREFVLHLRIGEHIEPCQAQQCIQAARGKSHCRDRFQIAAATFDIEHVLFLAEEIRLTQLDRRVATAVKHQGMIPPQQP
jgi:hypothetical protein